MEDYIKDFKMEGAMKRYDNQYCKKKFEAANAEIIDRWETAEKEVIRLEKLNERLEGVAGESVVRQALLTENLDETKQKLFTAEKELEIVKKSIKPLDEDECAMMEVYVAKEDAIKEEQIKRVNDVVEQFCKVVKHFKEKVSLDFEWMPDYAGNCELCDQCYNTEQMREDFRLKFVSDDAAAVVDKDYFMNKKTDVYGGVDMLYFDWADPDDWTYGGYYHMIKDMEKDGLVMKTGRLGE